MPTDVLTVGAGPTGLLLASVLARYGISLRLVDKRPHPSQTSKALSVFARTLEIFEQLGIAEVAISQGLSIPTVELYAQADSLARLSEAHRRYGAQQPCLYLIRPDGYISYRSQSPAIEPLKTYLIQVLGLKL